MKAYIINLKRSKNRRETIEHIVRNAGIEYQIVEAVDGKEMEDGDYERYLHGRPADEMMKSEVACTLSHCKVYRTMLEEGTKMALILEDDVLFNDPNILSLLQSLESVQPLRHITLLTYYWCLEDSLELSPQLKLATPNTQYHFCSPHSVAGVARAAAYVLTDTTATALLEYHNGHSLCNADAWNVYFQNGTIEGLRCIYPQPISENVRFGSDIAYVQGKVSVWIKKVIEMAVRNNVPLVKKYMMHRRKNVAIEFQNIKLKQ